MSGAVLGPAHFLTLHLWTDQCKTSAPTWVEHLPHRHGVVAVGLEVLREGGVVPRLDPPVGVEVVDPGGVGPAARQHGRPAGGAHRLLEEGGEGASQRVWGVRPRAASNEQRLTCAYAWRKTFPRDASRSMFGDLTVGSP